MTKARQKKLVALIKKHRRVKLYYKYTGSKRWARIRILTAHTCRWTFLRPDGTLDGCMAISCFLWDVRNRRIPTEDLVKLMVDYDQGIMGGSTRYLARVEVKDRAVKL